MDAQHPPSAVRNPLDPSVSDRLESWKAIAQFLKRDVRTVQRWETSEGLPVYRHQHSKQGSIYAYKSEIDSWWKARHPAFRHRHTRQRRSRTMVQTLKSLPYPRIGIYALLTIALALSVAKAKQMFLNRRRSPQTTSLSRPVTIAVAPFQAISSSSEDANVAVNITEELTTDCRRTQGLRVIDQSRVTSLQNSAATPQHMAQALHSDKLLRGTAGRDANKIHVTAELIDASSGASIWSKTFEQNGADVLQTEREIAGAIAADVKKSLAFAPSPDS